MGVRLLLALALAAACAAAAAAAAPGPPLATRIDRAQHVIDDPGSSALELASAGRFEQLAFRRLALDEALRSRTLPVLSPQARRAARAAVRAAGALGQLTHARSSFPNWRIVAPPPPATLLGYYREASALYGIGWQYLAAIELVETRMGRIRGLSTAGARGPMQFMPATWRGYGRGSIDSQHDSIMAAARLLAADGGRTSMAGALYHYNPSAWYVAAVQAYAGELFADARAFYGYYNWRVLYQHVRGVYVLPVGYPRVAPRRV